MERMTELSRMMLNSAKEPMSISEAVDILEVNAQFRTLQDKLNAFSNGTNLKSVLVEGLLANHPEQKRDAIDKKVRNWLSGRTQSISKEDAIELCFILKLDAEQADTFIAQIAEEGIHWRNPSEIAYGYALTAGMDYLQAKSLVLRVQEALDGKAQPAKEDSDVFTTLVKNEIMSISDQEALINYIIESSQKLGSMHNTAYHLFMDFMNTLEGGAIEDGLDEESAMSTKEVLENYLYRKMVPVSERKKGVDKTKAAFTDAQKSVRANWPDEAALSKMKSRQTDVTRKVLMLLFLVTNGGESEYEDDEDLDWEPTRDEIFVSTFTRLNQMLIECGFQRLDPRNRFDWMVLYCMCVDDIFDVDQKISDFLAELFPEE
ncbi:MAG: hypothetical protein IJC48_00930 [Clostridia bacterium]|nr:hypothetical protein [Clostridia bacterium]